MDLAKLSDKELIELQKRIEAEKENRKDSLLYKSNVAFDEKRFDALCTYLTGMLREKGNSENVYEMLHNPVWKISDAMFEICDYIYGNFEFKDRHVSGTVDPPKYVKCFFRNTSRLLIDRKEDYKAMYDELYSVIEKHMKLRTEKGAE